MSEQVRLRNVPVSWFATVMGMAGLTLAWHKAESLYQLSYKPSVGLAYLSLGTFILVSLIYMMKLLLHRDAVVVEQNHPIRLSFFPAFAIGSYHCSQPNYG